MVNVSYTALGVSFVDIQRSTDGGITFTTIASGVTASPYSDTHAPSGSSLEYEVVNAFNSDDFATTSSVTTPAPTIFDSTRFSTTGSASDWPADADYLKPDGTNALPYALTEDITLDSNGILDYSATLSDIELKASVTDPSLVVVDAEPSGWAVVSATGDNPPQAVIDTIARLKLLFYGIHQALPGVQVGAVGALTPGVSLDGAFAFGNLLDSAARANYITRFGWAINGWTDGTNTYNGVASPNVSWLHLSYKINGGATQTRDFACSDDLSAFESHEPAGYARVGDPVLESATSGGQVDCLLPGEYPLAFSNGETTRPSSWGAGDSGGPGNELLISLAQGFGLPVYSFTTWQYSGDTPRVPPQLVPLSGPSWQMDLAQSCGLADGIVIWSGGGLKLDEDADWWSATKRMTYNGGSGVAAQVPAEPNNDVTLTTLSGDAIAELTWTQPAPGDLVQVGGFRIERSSDGGTSWYLIGYAPAHDDGGSGFVYHWTDQFVSNLDSTYEYRVSAFNQFGFSSPRTQNSPAAHVCRLATAVNDTVLGQDPSYELGDAHNDLAVNANLRLASAGPGGWAEYDNVYFPAGVNQVTMPIDIFMYPPNTSGGGSIEVWLDHQPGTTGHSAAASLDLTYSSAESNAILRSASIVSDQIPSTPGLHTVYIYFASITNIGPSVPRFWFSKTFPTDVNAAVGTSGIDLNWNAVSGASGYRVYRREGANFQTGNDWLLPASPTDNTITTTSTSFTDTSTLEGGQLYYYMVTAVFSDGFESDQSLTAAVITGKDGSGGDSVTIADDATISVNAGNPYAGIAWAPSTLAQDFLLTSRINSILFAGRGGSSAPTLDCADVPITFDAGGTGDHLTITAGTVTLSKTTIFSDVTITGGDLKLAPHGASSTANVLVTSALTISGTGQLDIADNGVILNYIGSSPLSTVRSSLINGRNSGSWNGTDGINSSTAANHSSDHGVGYADNPDLASHGMSSYTSFLGQTVGSQSILIRYVPLGDVNLDGTYDSSDWTVILANVGGGSSTGQWYRGDLNYSGACTDADATLVGEVAGLGITAADGSFSLHWSAGPGFVDHYNVYRGTDPDFVIDADPDTGNQVYSGTSTTYYETGSLAPATTYYYKITWVDADGNETQPLMISVSPPDAPYPVSVDASGAPVVLISWSSVDDASSYNVYRYDSDDSGGLIGSTGDTSYSDDLSQGPGPGIYTYEVTSVGLNGLESAPNGSWVAIVHY